MTASGIYVIDGHDVQRYADPERAASSIEGYDAAACEYIATDGTAFEATVHGPIWGPVALHPTAEVNLDGLVQTSREVAGRTGVTDVSALPADPDLIWTAIVEAAAERRAARK